MMWLWISLQPFFTSHELYRDLLFLNRESYRILFPYFLQTHVFYPGYIPSKYNAFIRHIVIFQPTDITRFPNLQSINFKRPMIYDLMLQDKSIPILTIPNVNHRRLGRKIGNDFVQSLTIHHLTRNIPKIEWPAFLLSLHFSQVVDVHLTNLPFSLRSLTLAPNHKQPISFSDLPNLQFLDMGGYNFPIVPFPPHLQTLIVSDLYMYPLPLLHLHHLTSLDLGQWFCSSQITLPSSLTHLKLSSGYNLDLPLLPPTLRYLHLGACFNKPLVSLPFSLTSLVLSYTYCHSLALICLPHLLDLEYFSHYPLAFLPICHPKNVRVHSKQVL